MPYSAPADWPEEWEEPGHTPARNWVVFAGGLTEGEQWIFRIGHAQGSFHEFARAAELERSRILPTFEHVAVKVFLEAVPGNPMIGEHVFLTDICVAEVTISGTLDSDSVHHSELNEGQRLTVPIEQLSDWFLVRDGRGWGGFTMPLVFESLSKQERRACITEAPFAWFAHRGGSPAEQELVAIKPCTQCGKRNQIAPEDTEEICVICRDGGWRCACSICAAPLIRYEGIPETCVWCAADNSGQA